MRVGDEGISTSMDSAGTCFFGGNDVVAIVVVALAVLVVGNSGGNIRDSGMFLPLK